ncbi:histidine kinase [Catenulispora acidiphila DSM 44928]|uniref:histidine kinase n=2 Tax=Catenulispora TaxID=414878 RepID=C7QJ17_CATAD|nr:histidine kinase [Catenulispora acidiphila DSM 44928]
MGGGPKIGEAFPMKRFLLSPVSGRTARQYLFALVSAPLGLAGFVYAVVTLAVGGALSFTFVGLPLIALAIHLARQYAKLQRRMARGLLGVDIEAPPPNLRRQNAHGLLAKLGAALGDLPAWRSQLYLLVRFPLGIAYFVTLGVGVVEGLVMLTYPIWWAVFRPTNTDSHGVKHQSALQFGDGFYFDNWLRALLLTVAGVVWIYAAVWILKFLLWLDSLLMKALLGPTNSERRVEELTVSRAHAVDDSAARLRRIERDLHDGAQAQLVALAMQLGEAKENLDAGGNGAELDLTETRTLIDTAHRNAKQAINELRDLARGIHPAALDTGLRDALGTLAARSAMPVTVNVALAERPDRAIETIAYFCAAELLTNAAKHAAPTRAALSVVQEEGQLHLTVEDDGRGGAQVGYGGGLAGLLDRVRTVEGSLAVDSPQGGPTRVFVKLPMHV